MIALLALGSMGCDDAETSAPPDCPAYSGMAQERTGWRYSDTGNGSWIGTVQRRITSIDTVDDAQIITIKRTAVEQIDDKERDTVGTRTYRCDAQGLKLMSREDFTEPHPTFGGSGTNFRVRYNPGWLIIPTDLQAGQTWESDMVLTVASTTQFDTDETVQWSHRAEASSSDTPAGTFDSLRVTTTVDDGGDEFWAESSPVEGLVKTDQLHLDSYTP